MITRDEWLKALADAGVDHDADDQSAVTLPEFAAMLGVTRTTAAHRMQVLVRKGKAIRTHKWCANDYGRRIQYVAYKLVEEKKPRKGKAA
jgi:hypothetical protein